MERQNAKGMEPHLVTAEELDISEDELLRALQTAQPTQDSTKPGWFTVEELVELSGLGVTTVRKRLKALVKSGVLDYEKVTRTSLLGSRYHCNSFGIKAK